MDPYIDVIPDGRGEDIKKYVRERDDPDNEGRPTKRARANTYALLPPEGDRQDIEEPHNPIRRRDSVLHNPSVLALPKLAKVRMNISSQWQ